MCVSKKAFYDDSHHCVSLLTFIIEAQLLEMHYIPREVNTSVDGLVSSAQGILLGFPFYMLIPVAHPTL